MIGRLSRSFGLLAPHDIPLRINRSSEGRKRAPPRPAPVAAPADLPMQASGRSDGSETEPGETAREPKPLSTPQ